MATPRDRSVTPPNVPPTTPPPSGDYSYTLEVVMGMQATLGKLVESVDSLKDKTKSNNEKIDQMMRDIHTAKVILGVIGAVALVLIGVVGKAYADKVFK